MSEEGVATIYATCEAREADAFVTGREGLPPPRMPLATVEIRGDMRCGSVAGQGIFTGPGWTQPRGASSDFYLGPDDNCEPSALSCRRVDEEAIATPTNADYAPTAVPTRRPGAP